MFKIKKLIKENIVIIGIMVLAIILRLIYLDYKSLWLDEATNVILAGKDLSAFTFADPPLYYLVLHFALKVGNSEFIIRFPSVIFGILSVFVLYKVGMILYGKREALLGSFLLSMSSTSIISSQEAKYYSLFIFLSLLTIYFFLKMEYEEKVEYRKRNKIYFLISLILSIYAHYFAILLLASLIIFKLLTLKIWRFVRLSRVEIWKYVHNNRVNFLLMGIFLLSTIPIFSKIISQLSARSDPTHIDFVYQTHLSFNFLSEIFNFMLINEFAGDKFVSYIYSSIIIFLMIMGTFLSFKNKRIFTVIWLFIPIMIAAILTIYISNLYIRYLMFILPAIFLLTSRGAIEIMDNLNFSISTEKSNFNFRLDTLIAIFVLIILITTNFSLLSIYYKSKDNDWRDAAQFIKTTSNGDKDNIILIPGYNNNPFSYYYHGKTIEYANFDNFTKIIGNGKDTYVIMTKDVYVFSNDELDKLGSWLFNNSKIIAEFPGHIKILKKGMI